jgi:hypothetical protein
MALLPLNRQLIMTLRAQLTPLFLWWLHVGQELALAIEVDLLVPWAGLTGPIAGWVFGIAVLFRIQTIALPRTLRLLYVHRIANLVFSEMGIGWDFCVDQRAMFG